MVKNTYHIKGMDCNACAQMIELDFEDAGISASCDYAKEELTISGDVPHEKVKKLLEDQGYTIEKHG